MPEMMPRKGVKTMKQGQYRNAENGRNGANALGQNLAPANLLEEVSQHLLEGGQGLQRPQRVGETEQECLCYQLNIPSDMQLNAVQQAIFEDQARELGLDNARAQKLLEIAHRNAQEHSKAHRHQVAAWGDEVRHDKELGGSAIESTLAYARAGLAQFDPERKLYQVLQETGYANHPLVIRFLAAIGRAHAEDAVLLGSSAPTPMPRHERLYGKYNK